MGGMLVLQLSHLQSLPIARVLLALRCGDLNLFQIIFPFPGPTWYNGLFMIESGEVNIEH